MTKIKREVIRLVKWHLAHFPFPSIPFFSFPFPLFPSVYCFNLTNCEEGRECVS